MTDPLRIANCSGFFGDRLSAARERWWKGGPIDVLTGDWLAELTMLILARTRMKRPGRRLRAHLRRPRWSRSWAPASTGASRSSRTRAASTPTAAPRRWPRSRSEARPLTRRSPMCRGDDLLPRMSDLIAADQLTHFETGEPIKDASAFLTANAYLGCWGIVEALEQGADIVITGRVTDAAVVCGPAAWHHGWSRSDWNALAGARRRGSRDRVRHPGDRRQLLVLHRGPREWVGSASPGPRSPGTARR